MKYWSAIIDDVQEKQNDINQMNIWSTDAAEQMKIKIDSEVLASLAPDVAAANKGATAGVQSGSVNLGATGAPVQLTASTVVDFIIGMGLVLDEQNAPETGRYLVLPYWVSAMLKSSDLKAAYLTGDQTSPMRNGRIGMIDRFTVYSSNLLAKYTDTGHTCYDMFAGVAKATTFATQLTKTETLRAESTFGNIMRGLQVYGFKTLYGNLISRGYVYK